MATKKGNQILTNVYLEPEVYAALKELSESTGAPMAYYIRKGVEQVLAEHGKGKAARAPDKPRSKK